MDCSRDESTANADFLESRIEVALQLLNLARSSESEEHAGGYRLRATRTYEDVASVAAVANLDPPDLERVRSKLALLQYAHLMGERDLTHRNESERC